MGCAGKGDCQAWTVFPACPVTAAGVSTAAVATAAAAAALPVKAAAVGTCLPGGLPQADRQAYLDTARAESALKVFTKHVPWQYRHLCYLAIQAISGGACRRMVQGKHQLWQCRQACDTLCSHGSHGCQPCVGRI